MIVQQIIKPTVFTSTFRSLQIHRPISDVLELPLANGIPSCLLPAWLLLETVRPLKGGATTRVIPMRQAKQVVASSAHRN